MNWGERAAEWGWTLVLLVIGGIGTLVSRWISMLHKHERQLVLLTSEQEARTKAVEGLVASVGQINTRLDEHRRESSERLDALRRDLRDDFRTLIEFHTRGDDRREK